MPVLDAHLGVFLRSLPFGTEPGTGVLPHVHASSTDGSVPSPHALTRRSSCARSHPQAIFVGDDVEAIVKESIDAVLANAPYKHAFVGQWTNDVVETCVKRLAGLNKPFKYVVTCVIMQRNGAGLHTAASCFWDNDTDGSRTVRWENKSMYCVVTAFGLAL